MEKTVGVLAVQGAFIEHRRRIEQLGFQAVELRNGDDARSELDGLVLPGGESTVQSKLLRELDMFEPLANKLSEGMPVFGTCAGLILLAQQVANGAWLELSMRLRRRPMLLFLGLPRCR